MQLHCKGVSDQTFCLLGKDIIEQAESLEGASNNDRLAAIHETFFELNPFPQCSANSCGCFHYGLQREYQEVPPLSLSVPSSY